LEAARVKLSCSARATKYRRWRSSTARPQVQRALMVSMIIMPTYHFINYLASDRVMPMGWNIKS
jgi:hypothetical protein